MNKNSIPYRIALLVALIIILIQPRDLTAQFEVSSELYYKFFDSMFSLNENDSIKRLPKERDMKYHLTRDSLHIEIVEGDLLLLKGQYFVPGNIFSGVNRVELVDTVQTIFQIVYYKFPIRVGKWFHFDENGNVVAVEEWEMGFRKSVTVVDD